MQQEMVSLMIDGTPDWDRLRLIRKVESLFIWEMWMLESGVPLKSLSPLSSWVIPRFIECRGLLKQSGGHSITSEECTRKREHLLQANPYLNQLWEQISSQDE